DSLKYTFVFLVLTHGFIKVVVSHFELEVHPFKIYGIGLTFLAINFLYQNTYVNKYNYSYKMEDEKFNHLGPFSTASKSSTRFYLSVYGILDLISFKSIDKEIVKYMREQLVESSLYDHMKVLLDKGHLENTCKFFQGENN